MQDNGRSAEQHASMAAIAIENRFREVYPQFQYAYVEFLAEHLTDLSREFGGDLQPAIILAVLGQRMIQARIAVDGGAGTIPPPVMAVARIADVTGIPRETVRRKLAELERRGWVERHKEGGYTLRTVNGEAPARADLKALDDRGIARAARLFTALRALL